MCLLRGERSARVKARLVIACNDIPMFYDNHNAMINRYLIIPFFKSFSGMEDEKLGATLAKELSGIINWLILGLLDLGREGKFFEGEASKQAKRELRDRQNPVGAFFAKYCEEGADYRVSRAEMFSAYERFCEVNEIKKPDSRNMLTRRLKEAFNEVGEGRMKTEDREKAHTGVQLIPSKLAELIAEAEGFRKEIGG